MLVSSRGGRVEGQRGWLPMLPESGQDVKRVQARLRRLSGGKARRDGRGGWPGWDGAGLIGHVVPRVALLALRRLGQLVQFDGDEEVGSGAGRR